MENKKMMLQTYIYKLNYTTCTNRLCKKKCVQKAKNMNIVYVYKKERSSSIIKNIFLIFYKYVHMYSKN